MGQALYRTYRSRSLGEVVGQEHITQALSAALEKGLISHAYLFTGPHGTGKTSVARILAHAINDLPYNDDNLHLDIIEIDAASNRRIDEIRDLRDKVHIAPTSAKYKVYIIDEVHMLTREAFNALLKTLEEPPEHVVFILATTEVHKLPETIISRTQRFSFKPIELPKVMGHLRSIAKRENLDIDDEALQLIAEHGGGTFRGSISLLDQVRSFNRAVTAQDIIGLLGIASNSVIHELVKAVEQHDAGRIVSLLRELHDQSAEVNQVAIQLGQVIRDQFINKQLQLSHEQTIRLLTKLLDVPLSSDPNIFLEITLLDIALAGQPITSAPDTSEKLHEPESQMPPSTPSKQQTPQSKTTANTTASHTHAQSVVSQQEQGEKKPKDKTNGSLVITRPDAEPKQESLSTPGKSKSQSAGEALQTPKSVPLNASSRESDQSVNPPDSDEIFTKAQWTEVLQKIKRKRTLFSFLQTAHVGFEPGVINIEVAFEFHQKQLKLSQNQKALAEIIEQIAGRPFQINYTVSELPVKNPRGIAPAGSSVESIHNTQADSAQNESPARSQLNKGDNEPSQPLDYYVAQAEDAAAQPLDAVNNIFGGGELLQS